jgi:N-acetylglucosamine kinase-like BadF-type ATPase
MADSDRLSGYDVDNDAYTAWRGKQCNEDGAVATLRIDTASQILHLDSAEAARLGWFLLEAAGVVLADTP